MASLPSTGGAFLFCVLCLYRHAVITLLASPQRVSSLVPYPSATAGGFGHGRICLVYETGLSASTRCDKNVINHVRVNHMISRRCYPISHVRFRSDATLSKIMKDAGIKSIEDTTSSRGEVLDDIVRAMEGMGVATHLLIGSARSILDCDSPPNRLLSHVLGMRGASRNILEFDMFDAYTSLSVIPKDVALHDYGFTLFEGVDRITRIEVDLMTRSALSKALLSAAHRILKIPPGTSGLVLD